MIRYRSLYGVVFLALVMMLLGAAFRGDPVFAQTSDIEYLRTEAENARTFAAKQRATAKAWKTKAAKARKEAQESTHKRDREGWLEDAETYEQRRETAAIDADKAEAQAAEAEAKLVQALKQLEKSPIADTSDKSPPPNTKDQDPIPVADVIGVWKVRETGSILAIVQDDPNYSTYKLEAHSGPRVWKGWYTPFAEGDISRLQDARIVLRYKPTAEEMNPEIPEWARLIIEGQLELELELNEPQRCGGPQGLDGKFYPGKVRWDSGAKTATVEGRGKPRNLALSLTHFEPETAVAQTAIRIRPPGLGRKNTEDPTGSLLPFSPLSVLVERQLFHVDISLPYDIAKQQGEVLTIKLRSLEGGEEENIELLRGAFLRDRATKYTNYRPLFFGSSKPFLSQSWQNDIGQHAQEVDLDLKNGESVAIGFQKTFEVFPVYKDLEEYTIARYLEASDFLQKLHRIRLTAPGASRAEREDAHIRLLRLKNFQLLMANSENPKWLRVLIAEEYLGPVEEASQLIHDPAKLYGAGQIRLTNIHAQAFVKGGVWDLWPNALNDWERNGNNDRLGRFDGLVWSNKYEQLRVTQLVGGAWRERVRKAFDTFMVDITFGLYEWALSEMSVGYGRFRIGVTDLFALTGDVDHYGHKLPKGKKIEIIRDVLLSNVSDYAGETLRDNLIDEIAGYQAPGDKLLTIKDVAQAVRGRNTQRHQVKLRPPPGSRKNPDLPDTLTRRQTESIAPALTADGARVGAKQPLSCAPPRVGMGADDGSLGKAILIGERYGENAVLTKSDAPGSRQQEFGTCQAEAVLNAAGIDLDPIAVLRLMAENSTEFAAKLKTVSSEKHPLVYGYGDEEMQLLAGLLDRQSVLVPHGNTVSIPALQNWKKRGWSIKMAIHAQDYTGSGDNKHAVDIVDIKQKPGGCGYLITVHDKGAGGDITMPAKDFRERLADWDVMFHRALDDRQDGLPKLPGKVAAADDTTVRVMPDFFNPTNDDASGGAPLVTMRPIDRTYGTGKAHEIIERLAHKEKSGGELTRTEEVELYDARMSIRTAAQLTSDQAQRPSWITSRNMTLHDVVMQMPPTERNMPMHVTDSVALIEIAAAGRLNIPDGPSFSHGNGLTDTLREGNVAIRIRPGHEGFVELAPDTDGSNRGLIPFFWPSGEHKNGRRNTSQIPTEHLEYLDPGNRSGHEEWKAFPDPKKIRAGKVNNK